MTEHFQASPQILTARDLMAHVFGDRRDLVAMFSGKRQHGSDKLTATREAYFRFPDQVEQAEQWTQRQVGRETYFGAHLVFNPRRVRKNAAPILTLWSDVDAADLEASPIKPTAVVESSPGRFQAYARLSHPVSATEAEALNKRWALAFGADISGYDLTQVLRMPGTPNWKYDDSPIVTIVSIDDTITYDPDDLDRILPKLPDRDRKASGPAAKRDIDKADDELLQIMLRSKHGEKIRALLDNDTEQLLTYPELLTDGRLDANKADLSLCNSLAFFYGTVERADAAFRRSARMRDKWDEKHRSDGATYGEMTLEKAFAGRTEFYTPPAEGVDLTGALNEGQAAVEAAERIVSEAADCTEHRAEIERLLGLLATCQQQGNEYRRQLDGVKAVLRNRHLTAGRKVFGIVAIFELERKERRNPSERHILYRAAIAERAGGSESAAGDALEALAGPGGIFDKQTTYKTFQEIDKTTGEIAERRRRVSEFQAKHAGPSEALRGLASYAPEPPPDKATWGGKRLPRCSDHPSAGVAHYESFRCKACNTLLAGTEYTPSDQQGDLYGQVAPIGPQGPQPPGVVNQNGHLDPIGVRRALARVMATGGRIGWLPLNLGGTILQGPNGWQKLNDPSMYPWIPMAMWQAEQHERDRAGRMM
jgi:hypothetical protein